MACSVAHTLRVCKERLGWDRARVRTPEQKDRQCATTLRAITRLAPLVGTTAACAALGRPRASHYRRQWTRPQPPQPSRSSRPQPRALAPREQAVVRAELHRERFVDQAPPTIYATLLDEGRYLCSVSTMYRLLRAAGGSPEDARAFCRGFFAWYNHEHRHSGIGYHTPSDVHHGRAALIHQQRAQVLLAAYAAHPERFVRQVPAPPSLPRPAWINPPQEVPTTP